MAVHVGYIKNYSLIKNELLTASLLLDLAERKIYSLAVVETDKGELGLAEGGEFSNKKSKDAIPLICSIPVTGAGSLGSESFKDTYNTQYAYYAGSMANGISSPEMVISLGLSGYMGAYGTGGLSLGEIEQGIDKIMTALPKGPYLVNLMHSQNDLKREEELVSILLKKKVRAVEASAFINISPALIRYRLTGLKKNESGKAYSENRIIAKVSREEVAEKFMNPPDQEVVSELLLKGLITQEQAEWAKEISVADDITAEADSGGHTDNRPLVSLLPLMIVLRDKLQNKFNYTQEIRVGAAGGIGTAVSASGAFHMGADYIVTGSINQSCIEAGTSNYVKEALASTDMSDVVMAPSADMFESGSRVQVIKKGTMFPMNAQKLYDFYTRYPSIDDIPDKEKKTLETRIFQSDLATVWSLVEEYFSRADPRQLKNAETNPKLKMALVFRWYLGNSSRWAVNGIHERRIDMQIWCGQSMGAFNRWVEGSDLERLENRTVVAVADKIMNEAAWITMSNTLKRAGINNRSVL